MKKSTSAPLHTQMFISMTLLILVSTVLLVSLVLVLFVSRLSENYRNTFVHDLRVMDDMVTFRYGTIVNNVRTLLNNTDFKRIMREGSTDGRLFSAQDSLTLDEILFSILGSDNTIQTILVMNLKGTIKYSTKLAGIGSLLNHYYDDGSLEDASWIAHADAAKGREVFFATNVLYEKQDEFSFVKTLIAPENGRKIGYAVIIMKKSVFESMQNEKNTSAYEAGHFLVIDRNKKSEGELVYHSGDEETGRQVYSDYLQGNLKQYVYASCINEPSGWEIVNIISRRSVGKASAPIVWIAICITFAMLVILAFIVNNLSKRISRPIEKMEKVIRDVAQGNYKVEEEFDDSEVGQLGRKFKDLVNNNLELHESVMKLEIKERESELLLLQSQINPHFLYNTLDSLYFMALLEKADDIAEMVQALSDMFKLSLNQGKRLIKVRDEIEKIRAYCLIQDFRYHGRFSFHINVEESLLDREILTFMLQPLIENAVYHGLEPKRGNGSVTLAGQRQGDEMVFTVTDDGVGVSSPEAWESGYSLKNIRERVFLYYGAQYGLELSASDTGTVVKLRLPYLKQGGVDV